MKYLASTAVALVILFSGFAVGVWHASQGDACRAVQIAPMVTIVECP